MECSDYILNSNIISKQIEGRTVLVDIDTAKYYTFNEVGNVFLSKFLSEKNSRDIIFEVEQDYDIEQSKIEADFHVFFDDLIKKNILTYRKESAHEK